MKKSLLILVLMPLAIFAQSNIKDTDNYKRNSVYLGFLGNGGATFSLNYERTLINGHDKFAVRSGLGYAPNGNYYILAIPLEFIVVFGNNRHHIELGAGATYYGIVVNIKDGIEGNEIVFSSVLLIPRIGYRFTGRKGLLIRIGYTPVLQLPYLDDFDQPFQMYGGASIGYSF